MTIARLSGAARCLGLLAMLSVCARAALAVSPGDIAVIAYATDDPDVVSFVVLREIPAGTVLRFTDSGWQNSGSFRANEGGVQYTAATTLAPGTVVTQYNPFTSAGWSVNNTGVGSGGFLLATAGDQVLVFLGDAASPSFIYALNFVSGGFSDATSSNNSGVPAGLQVGSTAADLATGVDNGYYSGPTTGTPETLLAAIANPSNWTLNNSPQSLPSWDFTIVGGVPQVVNVALAGASFAVDESASVSVTLTGAPAVDSPVTIELTSGALAAPVQFNISNPASSGSTNVTFTNEGGWTLTATAINGGGGSDTTDDFVVGSPLIPPTAFAGGDRNVQLSAGTVTVALDEATADDADSLAGASYAWTPASGAGIVGWLNRTGSAEVASAPGESIVTFSEIGAYELTLTVTDADGLTATDSLTVFVTEATSVDEYDAPEGYYSAATGTGAALKSQLSSIITAGHVQQTYGAFKTSSARYDADPANPSHILLMYNRASVPGAWDGGATWNREHVWPQSLQPGDASDSTKGNLGDPYVLRPANPSINSSRGNKPFGNYTSTGTYGAVTGGFFFPGDADKGDAARALMYSATRYMSTLTLVNGTPGSNQMGDLASLVRWNYTDTPDTFERRRGHLIYLDQFNRNPYIDHPEWVWSVFGDGANDSTLYVSPTEPADGASVSSIGFAPVIVGAPLSATSSVTLQKAGDDPTYYAVTASGNATSSVSGRFNAFDIGAQQRTIQVGLSGLTASAGLLSGTVEIDNLDISSEGQGQGAADGDDLIELSVAVLDHAEASFASATDENALTIGFGSVSSSAAVQLIDFTIYNVESTAGYTAALAVVGLSGSGATNVFITDAGTFELPAGDSATFTAEFDPSAAPVGEYVATYAFTVADENLPGGTAGTSLTLTLKGTIGNALYPFDDDGDGDIDEADVVNFVSCLSGPNGGMAQGACANHDADADGDVDLMDAAALQELFTGALR